MKFIFREIKRIEAAGIRYLQAYRKKLEKAHPELSEDGILDLALRQKKPMVRFIQDQRKKSVFYQCLILQTSSWMKSSFRMHSDLLAKHSNKATEHWAEVFYNLGPKYRKLFWAKSIDIASNYVRHKEEWHFNTIEVDRFTQKVKTKKNIISTLTSKKARKNAQYLIQLGVKQDEIFKVLKDACSDVLEILESETPSGLEENCKEWLKALNDFVKSELYKLLPKD